MATPKQKKESPKREGSVQEARSAGTKQPSKAPKKKAYREGSIQETREVSARDRKKNPKSAVRGE